MSKSRKAKKRQIKVTAVFDRNFKAKTKIVVNEGGARSSKSYSVIQLLLQYMTSQENKNILILRKTLPALKESAYKVFIDMLKDYGYYQYCEHNKTDMFIKYYGVYVKFGSLDDPEKIKSTSWNLIMMEEVNEFSWEDFLILFTRLSAPTKKKEPNQIFLLFNPSEPYHWIFNLKDRPDVTWIHSTYKDNPFLDSSYISILEGLKEQDYAMYQVYALGQKAELKGLIYQNWLLTQNYPEKYDDTFYGLDFGFNNESALAWIGEKDTEYYVRGKLYATGLTNTALIEKLKELIPEDQRSKPIYADNAEPDRIEEIHGEGFNCQPCKKGKVKDGIDLMKALTIHHHPDDEDLNKERKGYKWKVDKNGNVLDEPVKYKDHYMDAIRYGIHTHVKDRGNIITVISLKEPPAEQTAEERELEILKDDRYWN